MPHVDEIMRNYIVNVEQLPDPGFVGVLSNFCQQEYHETGGECTDRVVGDIEECRNAVYGVPNELISHPWYTDSQIVLLKTYCDGVAGDRLTDPNDRRHMTEREVDGLLACMLAACDERVENWEQQEIFAKMKDIATLRFAILKNEEGSTPQP